MRERNGNMRSGTLNVEHMRMEMAKIFQEVDRLGGTRVGTEGEGHLVSQSVIGIAFRAAKRSFDITAAAVGMVRAIFSHASRKCISRSLLLGRCARSVRRRCHDAIGCVCS